MRTLIFYLLLMVMYPLAHACEGKNSLLEGGDALKESKLSGDPKLLEQAWICPHRTDLIPRIEKIKRVLAQLSENNFLLVLEPLHYTLTMHSWDPLLTKATKYDILADENSESKEDRNGRKQVRDGFIIFRNTDNTREFIKEWFMQAYKGAVAQDDHPTLFSYLISNFVNKGLTVSNLVWEEPFPLQWSDTPLKDSPLASLHRLRRPSIVSSERSPSNPSSDKGKKASDDLEGHVLHPLKSLPEKEGYNIVIYGETIKGIWIDIGEYYEEN